MSGGYTSGRVKKTADSCWKSDDYDNGGKNRAGGLPRLNGWTPNDGRFVREDKITTWGAEKLAPECGNKINVVEN
jgi:hypothetical protein